MAGLGIVDVVPEDGGMVALDEFSHVGVGIFSVGVGLRLDGLIVGGNADRSRNKCPVVAA